MKNIFTGQAYSYTQGFNVLTEIKARGCRRRSRSRSAPASSGCSRRSCSERSPRSRPGNYTDRVLTVLAMIGVSFPPFFLGAMLIYYLGYQRGHLPDRRLRAADAGPRPVARAHDPAVVHAQSVLFIGFYSRVLRSTILDTINEDYVRTAHAKGLSDRQVLIRHILRNSLIPIISLWGLDIAQVIGGGAILTEIGLQPARRRTAGGRIDQPPRHHHDPRDRDADRVRGRDPRRH